MSEETVQQEGGWSGLKKTLVGTISTAILAGGTFITTKLFGGGESKEETKTEQAAAPVINVNLENNNTNQQKQSGGTNTIIKERVIEKAAPVAEKPAKKSETEEAPW
jgi:tRNA U34 5-carboxymethylaminomethyl modifying enzyme MnmG/GidA